MYENLIKELRCDAEQDDHTLPNSCGCCDECLNFIEEGVRNTTDIERDAADAIESLQSEVERLKVNEPNIVNAEMKEITQLTHIKCDARCFRNCKDCSCRYTDDDVTFCGKFHEPIDIDSDGCSFYEEV